MNCFLEISINDEPAYTFRTAEASNCNNVFWRNFEKRFNYECLYEDLSKRFFEIRFHTFKNSNGHTDIKSIYKVDLYTLAIGPIHHSIELVDKRRKYLGKLSCDITFS